MRPPAFAAPAWWHALDAPDRLLVGLLALVVALFLLTVALTLRVLGTRMRRGRRRRRRRVQAARWMPVLLDVLAGEASPEALHALVHRGERLRFVGFLAAFARRVRGSERARVCALARPYLPALVARTRHRDGAVRARAIDTLALLGPEYEGVAVAALDDPDPEVGAIAARALARREHAAAAPRVLDRLELFQGWDRTFVAGMLAAIGPSTVEPLRALLQDRARAPRLRAAAADALAELSDLNAADLAGQVLAETADRDLAAGCLRLLARVGVARHAVAARARLGDPDALLRAQAAVALGYLGEPTDADALEARLADSDPWVALRAGEALRRLHAENVLAAIARAQPAPAAVRTLGLPAEAAGPAATASPGDARAVLAREVLAQVGA